MREEALRVQRQLSNEELHNLYVLSNLSYVIPYFVRKAHNSHIKFLAVTLQPPVSVVK